MIADVGSKVKNLKIFWGDGSLTDFILYAFSGTWSTLTEISFEKTKMSPSAFKRICTECLSLKKLFLNNLDFNSTGDCLEHVSKLKELEHFILTFLESTTTVNMSVFRNWQSSTIKDLSLYNLTGINLQVRWVR